MKYRNNLVPIGVEHTPHEQAVAIQKQSRVFYHPLWAITMLAGLVFCGIGLAFCYN